MLDYELYEPVDDTPLEIAYANMFSMGFYRCPKPNYGIEVSKHEDESLHPAYYGDLIPARAS